MLHTNETFENVFINFFSLYIVASLASYIIQLLHRVFVLSDGKLYIKYGMPSNPFRINVTLGFAILMRNLGTSKQRISIIPELLLC